MFRSALVPIFKNISALPHKGAPAVVAVSQNRHVSYGGGTPTTTTMDDLPVPSGSWESQYNANQSKYNMHLGLGIAVSIITIITMKASGLVYLNYSPPPLDD